MVITLDEIEMYMMFCRCLVGAAARCKVRKTTIVDKPKIKAGTWDKAQPKLQVASFLVPVGFIRPLWLRRQSDAWSVNVGRACKWTQAKVKENAMNVPK